MAPCPVHQQPNPSFNELCISLNAIGGLECQCQAGCGVTQINKRLREFAKPFPTLYARHGETPKAAARPRFEFLSDDEFASGDYRPEWLIKNVLVKGEPAGIGGPMKAMKTSLAVDMAISLATGTPFVGTFEVPRAVPTAIVSCESGQATLVGTRKNVLKAKGFRSDYKSNLLHWCFDAPRFTDEAALELFVGLQADRGVSVAFLDPLYQMLGDVNAASIFDTGSRLGVVSKMFLAKGITPIILHHANRQLMPGKQMQLSNLSHAGFAEFVRQFILVNRKDEYVEGSGYHRLSMSIGGSAGHSGGYVVEIDEGKMEDDFQGRKWEVRVTKASDHYTKKTPEQREAERFGKEQQTEQLEEKTFLEKLDAVVLSGLPAMSINELKSAAKWLTSRAKRVAHRMVEKGIVEPHTFKKATGPKIEGYRRTNDDRNQVNSEKNPVNEELPGSGSDKHEQPGNNPVKSAPCKGATTGLPGCESPGQPEKTKRRKYKKTVLTEHVSIAE